MLIKKFSLYKKLGNPIKETSSIFPFLIITLTLIMPPGVYKVIFVIGSFISNIPVSIRAQATPIVP